MPRFNGLEALKLMQRKGLDLPFMIVPGKADEDTLVRAMKAGVHDYIRKKNLARLSPAVERELREAAVRRERIKAEEALRESEKEARRLAGENAVLAEIGRVIRSTPSIEEAYKRFSDEVRQLLAFERFVVTLINKEKNTLVNRYVEGVPAPGRDPGGVFPLNGTATDAMAKTRKSLLIQVRKDNQDGGTSEEA